MAKIDPRIRKLIERVTGKRPRTVIDHIVKHGHITTEEIAGYGYDHPPRAARDVREQGVPLETFRVRSSTGRSIGAYRFGDPDKVKSHKLGGRSVLPNELRDRLCATSGEKCFVCLHRYAKRYLQIDHRVPYEVAGAEADASQTEAFMLLCGSCQRSKSWSCEHCQNWEDQDPDTCARCYWAMPEDYDHVATQEVRRLDIVFSDGDAVAYDELARRMEKEGRSMADCVREMIRDCGRADE